MQEVAPLDVNGLSLIEGWTQGIAGMKYGGVRLVTIPSELAYADEEVSKCEDTSVPLKFLIMPIKTDKKLRNLNDELSVIESKLNSAYSSSLGDSSE